MVRAGMGWWHRKYAPADRELAGLEAEAKAARRGLWAQEIPTPPWEWRHPRVADSGQVVGNARSHVYHAPNCPSVGRMKEANRVAFASAKEAEAAEYRKAVIAGRGW